MASRGSKAKAEPHAARAPRSLPERLRELLGKVQSRDSYGFFLAPVDLSEVSSDI
jgi:hypothetical protein